MRPNKYYKERQWNNTLEEAKRFRGFVEKKAEGKIYDFELCQDLNNELDKCLDLQEQTIKEIQRTNKILDALNFA